MRKAFVGAAVLAAVAAALFLYHLFAPRVTAASQPPLARLEGTGVAPFARLFDESLHQTRILMMLSPT